MDRVVTYPLQPTPPPIRYELIPKVGTRATPPPPTPPPPAETPGEDTDVWSGHGPPPTPAPPGYENHDYYIDLDSGEVYQLNQ